MTSSPTIQRHGRARPRGSHAYDPNPVPARTLTASAVSSRCHHHPNGSSPEASIQGACPCRGARRAHTESATRPNSLAIDMKIAVIAFDDRDQEQPSSHRTFPCRWLSESVPQGRLENGEKAQGLAARPAPGGSQSSGSTSMRSMHGSGSHIPHHPANGAAALREPRSAGSAEREADREYDRAVKTRPIRSETAGSYCAS